MRNDEDDDVDMLLQHDFILLLLMYSILDTCILNTRPVSTVFMIDQGSGRPEAIPGALRKGARCHEAGGRDHADAVVAAGGRAAGVARCTPAQSGRRLRALQVTKQ